VITGSPDTTIRVWNVGAPNPLSQIIRAHEGSVTGVSLHPTGDYVLSTSADQNWAFSDIRTGKLLTKVKTIIILPRLFLSYLGSDILVLNFYLTPSPTPFTHIPAFLISYFYTSYKNHCK